MPIAEKIIASLAPNYKRIELGGSLRRGCQLIGDIDILATGPVNDFEPGPVLTSLFLAKDVSEYRSLRRCWEIPFTPAPLRVDIWVVPEENWGAALMYITGPGKMNVMMRRWALHKGLGLDLLGVFKEGKMIASKTEEDCFKALGWKYLSPADRGDIFNYCEYIDQMNDEQNAVS